MSATKPFIFGGIASLTAEFGTFPIDTTKTRLQVQGQVSDEACRSVRYRGMLHALLRISREEGVQALYYGIAPALLRQASYGTIKIGLYHYFKQRMALHTNNGESLFTNILAGTSSGAIASCIANPTDVLKVRMQAATSQTYRTKSNVFDLFRQIYQNEGWKGLYRGVGPTAQRAAMIAGVMLPSYDFLKKTLLDTGLMGNTVSTHFLASFLAGILGTLVTNPVDVVKSRMMNQLVLQRHSQHRHFYTSSWDCLLVTLRSEGPLALYKGFVPSYLRLGPWNIIFFITYEQLKSLPL